MRVKPLRAPDAPIKGLEMFMVLLGPGSGCQTRVIPSKPLVFPRIWRQALSVVNKITRQKRYYYYFEARSPEHHSRKAYRSPVDWFILRNPPAKGSR